MGRSWFPVPAVAVLLLWVALPFVSAGVVPQDAVPMLVAGDLVGEQPELVYDPEMTSLYDLSPAVRDRTCAFYDDEATCQDEGVAFVSPPLVLPILAGLARADDDIGVLVLRLAGVAGMVGAFVLLVRRLPRPIDVVPITGAAALLTIAVQRQVELGQTTGLLALLAAVPLSGVRGRRAEAAVAAVLAVAIAFKLFPAVLLVVLLVAGRRRLLALSLAGCGVLGVLALALAPASLWREFVELSATVTDFGDQNPHNLAVSAVFESLGVPGGAAMGRMVGVVAAIAFTAIVLRRASDDLRWAAALPVTLLALPQVWNHYLVLAVPAVLVASVGRVRRPDLVLLAAAGALVPFELLPTGTTAQVVGLGLLVAALAAVAAWAQPVVRPVARPVAQ